MCKIITNITQRGKNEENENDLKLGEPGHDRPLGTTLWQALPRYGVWSPPPPPPDELKNINDFDWLKDKFNEKV